MSRGSRAGRADADNAKGLGLPSKAGTADTRDPLHLSENLGALCQRQAELMLMMQVAWGYGGKDKPTDADYARHLGKRPAELMLMMLATGGFMPKAGRADAHDAQGFSVPWAVDSDNAHHLRARGKGIPS